MKPTDGEQVSSLRVGVLLDDLTLPAWRAEAIRRVAAVDGVEIVVVVRPDPAAPPPPRQRDLAGLAWRAYLRTMPTMERPRNSRVMRPDSLAAELAGVAELVARTEPVGRFRERFSDATIAQLRELQLDVLLRFAFGILVGEVLNLPTYGVWSFHFGDEERYRGGPAGFWEVYEGADQIGAILQRLNERLDAGVVLRKGHVPVIPTSLQRTWDAAHEQALDWAAEVCRDILDGRWGGTDAVASPTTAPIRRRPTNLQMASYMMRIMRRRVRQAVQLRRDAE